MRALDPFDRGCHVKPTTRISRQCRRSNRRRRRYLPRGTCLKRLTQKECDWIANELNTRPRKRHGFKTPAEIYHASRDLLHFNVESTPPAAEQHRCQGDFQLINDTQVQVLLDPVRSTRDTNITTACEFPQTPEVGSEWMNWFPTPELRALWTHRLGNPALLAKSVNSSARN